MKERVLFISSPLLKRVYDFQASCLVEGCLMNISKGNFLPYSDSFCQIVFPALNGNNTIVLTTIFPLDYLVIDFQIFIAVAKSDIFLVLDGPGRYGLKPFRFSSL
jgi:hypothetical protein